MTAYSHELEHKIITIKNVDIVVKTFSSVDNDWDALMDALKKVDRRYGFEIRFHESPLGRSIEWTAEPDKERNEEDQKAEREAEAEANKAETVAAAAE